MAQVASLWVKLGIVDKDFDKGLKKAERNLKQFGDRLSGLGQRLTIGFSLPLALASGAAIKFGMDAVESENLFAVSMGKMADSARAWSEELRENLGLNSYELRKNVGMFTTMLTSMGLGKKAAFDMSKSLVKLSYDMASFYNISQSDAFQKIQSGISGEAEPLKRLGILVNETTIKTWALNNGLIKQGEQLSETGKVMARFGVIMGATKNAQGDLARTLDSPANKLRILQEQLKQAWTELGIAFLPAASAFLTAMKPVVGIVSKLADWFMKLNEPTRNLIAGMVAFAIALGPVLLITGKIVGAFSAIAGILPALATGMVALRASFVPFLAGGAIIFGLAAIVGLLAGIKYYQEEIKRINSEMPTLQLTEKSDADLKKTQKHYEQLLKAAEERETKARQDYESIKGREETANALMRQPDMRKKDREKTATDLSEAQIDTQRWRSSLEQIAAELSRRKNVPSFNLTDVTDMTTGGTNGKVDEIISNLETSIASLTAKSMVFGEKYDNDIQKIEEHKNAINKLLESGLKPESEQVQKLVQDYKNLQDEINKTISWQKILSDIGEKLKSKLGAFGDLMSSFKSGSMTNILDTAFGIILDSSEELGKAFEYLMQGIAALIKPIDALLGVIGKVLGPGGMGAAVGAGAGYLLGGGVGAAIGGIVGLIGGIFGRAAEKQRKAAEAWQKFLKTASVSELFGKREQLAKDLVAYVSAKKRLEEELKEPGSQDENVRVGIRAQLKHAKKQIALITAQLGDAATVIRETLGIVASQLSETVRGAFSAETVEEFTSQLKTSLHQKIRDALITAFMESAAMQPLFESLSDSIMQAVEDGLMTTGELSAIDAIIQQIGKGSEAFYEALEALGLGINDLTGTMEDLNNAMLNVPEGFKVEKFRYAAIDTGPPNFSPTDWGPMIPGMGGPIIIEGDVYGFDDFAAKVNQASQKFSYKDSLANFGTAPA